MSDRMWTTGAAASFALALVALLIALLTGSSFPLLYAAGVLLDCVLPLLAIAVVEWYATRADEAQVTPRNEWRR